MSKGSHEVTQKRDNATLRMARAEHSDERRSNMMTLILGGSGSGKSAYAEDYLLRVAGDKKKYYIATMQIRDAEMQAKVDRHHRLRQGKGFTTIEQPTELEQAVLQMEPAGAVLLECMSNLTANEMFSGEQPVDRQTVITKILQGMEGLRKQADPLVIVSNNVFEDGMIYDDSTMEYIEALGRINERLAAEADEVVEVIAGIPQRIKPYSAEEMRGTGRMGRIVSQD